MPISKLSPVTDANQKRDPMVVKELCVVTLTKIYTSIQQYQTLVREIATPTLPTFATACLQILKPVSTSKVAVKASMSFTETIFEAFSALIPLYPTTLRPSVGHLRSATRPYLAPTNSDELLVPKSLESSSRRLVTKLHMTAAKNGGADEWSKHFGGLIKQFHETADQVFRAIQENWESTTGYLRQAVVLDVDPSGGGDSFEQLPQWSGIQAGSERLIGLLGFLEDNIRCATKVAVTIPISALTDLISRVSLIVPPTPGKAKNESSQTNPAIGREEREDLWAAFPDIQVATLQLTLTLVQRLGRNFTPLAQETLEQVARTVETGYRLPEIRHVAFSLTTKLLALCGPTMSKTTVDGLHLITMACCRDLLGAAGHLKVPKQQASSTAQNGTKSRAASQNADAFLKSHSEEESVTVLLKVEHLTAAEGVLTSLLGYLPQKYIIPDLRSRMLRTAILCQIKDAQIASILNPAKDKNGRTAQVILPYLHQQFPRDEAVEILRFNFRPVTGGKGGDIMDMDDDMEIDAEEPAERPANGYAFDRPFQISSAAPATVSTEEPVVARSAPSAPAIAAEIQPSPFLSQSGMQAAVDLVPTVSAVSSSTVPLKRKSEGEGEAAVASKRVDVDVDAVIAPDPGFGSMGSLVEDTLAKVSTSAATSAEAKVTGGDEDSDDESVHLNMDLDSDDDDEN